MSEFISQAVLSLGIAMALVWSIENRQRLMRLENKRLLGDHRYPDGALTSKTQDPNDD